MIRAACVFVGLLAAAAPARAADARASAQATIVDPAALRLLWPAAVPSVVGEADGARFVGRIPALGMALGMPANARLVIMRQDIAGAGLTAPRAFEVVSAGPARGYVVRTSYSRDMLRALDGLVVGGELSGEAAASIDVAPSPAFGDGLVVVVQYN